MARVAEKVERFEDMITFLITAANGRHFTIDERNLLSVGFKNLTKPYREAIGIIVAIGKNPKYENFGDSLVTYKIKIEKELCEKCM